MDTIKFQRENFDYFKILNHTLFLIFLLTICRANGQNENYLYFAEVTNFQNFSFEKVEKTDDISINVLHYKIEKDINDTLKKFKIERHLKFQPSSSIFNIISDLKKEEYFYYIESKNIISHQDFEPLTAIQYKKVTFFIYGNFSFSNQYLYSVFDPYALYYLVEILRQINKGGK